MKRAVGQVTKAVDFHFCTENRIKQHVESQPRNEYREVDFAAELRKHPPSPVRSGLFPAGSWLLFDITLFLLLQCTGKEGDQRRGKLCADLTVNSLCISIATKPLKDPVMSDLCACIFHFIQFPNMTSIFRHLSLCLMLSVTFSIREGIETVNWWGKEMSSQCPVWNGHNDQHVLSPAADTEGTHYCQTFQPVPGKQKKTWREHIRIRVPCWAGRSIPKNHTPSLPFEEQEIWWRWAVLVMSSQEAGHSAGGRATRVFWLLYWEQFVATAGLALNCWSLWLEFIGPPPGRTVKARFTNPKTPLLLTKQRFRPATCKTTAELEAEEIEKLQQ